MEQNTDKSGLREQHEPVKHHGTTDESRQQEKYLRDSGKIEDLPEQSDIPKMTSNIPDSSKTESAHLTDRSGEEKKEDYINTDERKKDLDKRAI